MEAIPVLAIIFSFVMGVVYMQNKGKEQRERLRLLDEAIRRGQLDDQMRSELMSGFNGKRRRHSRQGGFRLSRLSFGVGWLAMFIGVGLLFVDEPEAFTAGCVVSGIGFALVTLPLAMRELDMRDREAAQRQNT
jgi:hypothetical protein